MTEELIFPQDLVEWQPARLIVDAHSDGDTRELLESIQMELVSSEQRVLLQRMVVWIQPVEVTGDLIETYRARGCDSTKFYRLHPSSVKKIGYHLNGIKVACEHEIATD